MDYKELFINKDDVLLIRKELVRILGDLNEAVILNQLNYWIEINKKAEKNLYDGKYWIFNTYQTWKETDFDFWSTDTIRRTLTRLENKGIILTANYNKLKIDKTKWYTIDYEKLQKLIDEHEEKQIANKKIADCVHDMANCTDGNGNISKAIPENTKEITNKDYIPETTDNSLSDDKDNSKDKSFELYNSHVAEEHGSRISMSIGVKHREKKEVPLKDMPTRAREMAYCFVYDKELSQGVYDCIKYFLEKYKEKHRREHLPLRNDTLQGVVEVMLSSITVLHDEDFENVYESVFYPLVCHESDSDDRYDVIDKYFETQFNYYDDSNRKVNIDYSLVHFTNENVITHVMQKCYRGNDSNWYESDPVNYREDT